jgi:HAD superfamily hydrolase (TIGR01509 family)
VIEAVIFDMDGLLVDSEPAWFEARRVLLEPFGKNWSDSDQKRLMGVSSSVWVEYVYEKLGGAISQDEIRHNVVGVIAAAYLRGDVPLLPGAGEALQYCHGRYRLGLASGSPRVLIDAALSGTGWHRYFEEVVSSDECAHGKPAPDVYIAIMTRMGLDPESTAVVEDSLAGILSGKAAKTKVVAVPGAYVAPDDEVLSQADKRLQSLHGLPGALEQL